MVREKKELDGQIILSLPLFLKLISYHVFQIGILLNIGLR